MMTNVKWLAGFLSSVMLLSGCGASTQQPSVVTKPAPGQPAMSLQPRPLPLFHSCARALRFSRDGKKLLVAGIFYTGRTTPQMMSAPYDDRLRIYTSRGKDGAWTSPQSQILPGDVGIYFSDTFGSVSLTPNFQTLLTTQGAWGVTIVDVYSGRSKRIIEINNGAISSLDGSPAGTAIAIGMTRRVEIRDARTLQIVRAYVHGGQGTRVQFGPLGKTILCSWEGLKPHCISTKTARQIGWPRWVYRVRYADAWAFSSDGKLLACAKGNTIKIWTVPQNRGAEHRLKTLRSSLLRVDCLQFSSDSRTLAAGGLSRDSMPVRFLRLAP